MPLRGLISLLEQELVRMHYKETTLKYYRVNWARLVRYFEGRNEEFYSETVAMEYVDEKCDFFTKEKAGLLTQSNTYLFRIVRMIGDFQLYGTVSRRYMRSLSRVNKPEHKKFLDAFNTHYKSCDYSVSTVKSYCRTTENFLSFLEARGIYISPTCLTDYVKTLMGYSYKMVEFTLCGVRSFLRFLYSERIIEKDISVCLPCIKSRKQARIPSVWRHEDLQKLLNLIDRGNPAGKRDYAIILLVTRFGLRSVDVKNLMLSDIKWGENKIEFIQSKTNELVCLLSYIRKIITDDHFSLPVRRSVPSLFSSWMMAFLGSTTNRYRRQTFMYSRLSSLNSPCRISRLILDTVSFRNSFLAFHSPEYSFRPSSLDRQ